MEHTIIELQDDFNPVKVWLVQWVNGIYSITQKVNGFQVNDWVQTELKHIASACNRNEADILRAFKNRPSTASETEMEANLEALPYSAVESKHGDPVKSLPVDSAQSRPDGRLSLAKNLVELTQLEDANFDTQGNWHLI